MHIPDVKPFFVARANAERAEPLEVVFADTGEYVLPSDDAEFFKDRGEVTRSPLDYFTSRWNAGFHLGGERDVAGFGEHIPTIRELRNPNVAIAPRIHGYSELHGLLASFCPDDVLTRHGLKRRSANFLLCPISLDRTAERRTPVSPARLNLEAQSCCAAFKEFVWARMVQRGRKRFRQRDFDPSASLHVLLDDSPFWMNAAYRLALAHARTRLRDQHMIFDTLPIEYMADWRIRDLFGHRAGLLPSLGPAEVLEVRHSKRRVLVRRCREVSRSPGSSQFPAPPGSVVIAPMTAFNTLVELEEGQRKQDRIAYEPLDIEPLDSGLQLMPLLQEGALWDPSSAVSREAAFSELLAAREMASIEPVVGMLAGEVLPEDLPDRGWSYLKEDVLRRLHYRRRAGGTGFKVEVRETVDDLPVIDEQALLVDGEDVLRSVMVTLDPRRRRVIVLLRAGRTRNQVAADVGFEDHSGLSRLLGSIESTCRRALGLSPSAAGSKRRRRLPKQP